MRRRSSISTPAPSAATASAAKGTATQKPTRGASQTAAYMPSMYSEPWAKLTMRLTPKMSDSPAARRKSELAPASPFRNCRRTAAPLNPGGSRKAGLKSARLLLPQRADFLVGGLVARAVGVAPIHHHALAVLLRKLPHVGAHRRLVVDRAPHDRAEGRLHLQAFERGDELLGVGAARLLHRFGDGVHRGIADDRALARIVVPAL